MTPTILTRLPEGIALRQQGRHDEARALMERLWTENGGATGDPLGRCVIAHSLADAQDDVHDELRWDLAALEAAHAVTDDQVAAGRAHSWVCSPACTTSSSPCREARRTGLAPSSPRPSA